jgi:hypothetical protein
LVAEKLTLLGLLRLPHHVTDGLDVSAVDQRYRGLAIQTAGKRLIGSVLCAFTRQLDGSNTPIENCSAWRFRRCESVQAMISVEAAASLRVFHAAAGYCSVATSVLDGSAIVDADGLGAAGIHAVNQQGSRKCG